ncbi:MAG: N-acetylmuramoyl-L-alanine amidase family protein [Ignavibacteriales bacterium]
MDNLITNIRVGVSHEPPPRGPWSRVVIESTVRLTPAVTREGRLLTTRIPGVRLNMPDCIIPVYDGLVSTVSASTRGESACLEILLEHDVPASVRQEEGMPHRMEVRFDSGGVYSVLKGRTLAIDPGHGGRDKGGRGPVSLVEKDVVLQLAGELRRLCSNLGLSCFLTRDRDVAVPLESRVRRAVTRSANAIVSIHTGVERDRSIRGVRVGHANPAGEDLARLVLLEMVKKLNLPDRGVSRVSLPAGEDPFADLRIPAIVVEFATLTNPVDEGWVRSRTFMERAALAILNGIKNYYWSAPERSGRES